MRTPKAYQRIIFGASIAFLLLLAGFQAVILSFSEADILRQATLQSMRCQRIAKVALLLQGHPDENIRVQAISELQNTLPVWETQQARILAFKSSDLSLLATQSQPDFIVIDAAAKVILAHPKSQADPTQVSIIVQNEHDYSVLMTQLTSLLQQHIEDFNRMLVIVQDSTTALIMALVIAQFMLAEKDRHIAQKAYAKQKTKEQEEQIDGA
jgi:hypothetical protein